MPRRHRESSYHMSRWWNGMGKADTALSIGEWVFRVATVVGIGTGGVSAWFLAKLDPFFSGKSLLYWYAVALITGIVIAATIWLAMSAFAKQALTKYYASLAIPKSDINPLDTIFVDKMIAIEDLRLPHHQLHERKHFIGCKFIGPGSIGIMGGSYTYSAFTEIGDVVAIPDGTSLSGLVILQDCSVESCEFIRVSIFVDQGSAKGFKSCGANVKGMIG